MVYTVCINANENCFVKKISVNCAHFISYNLFDCKIYKLLNETLEEYVCEFRSYVNVLRLVTVIVLLTHGFFTSMRFHIFCHKIGYFSFMTSFTINFCRLIRFLSLTKKTTACESIANRLSLKIKKKEMDLSCFEPQYKIRQLIYVSCI